MDSDTETDVDCENLLEFLRTVRGFDFTGYKRSSLTRRLRKRMQGVGISDYAQYIDYLEVHPDEFEQLFNTILINVTTFLRDPAVWDVVSETVLPRIISSKNGDGLIRVWSAGCASGEEAYTVVMLLAEQIGIEAVRDRVKIYATDLDEDALQQARLATYSDRAVSGIPTSLREKYFKQNGDDFVFNGDLRRSVIFGRHDLMVDAPISRIDLLLCRNVMMYFNSESQAKILNRFQFAVLPNGFLILGKAELPFHQSSVFSPIDLKHRIFVKVPKIYPTEQRLLMSPLAAAQESSDENGEVRFNHWHSVFESIPGSLIVVNRGGTVVLVNDRARNQFRINERNVGRPLQDMELSYRPVELRSLIDQTYKEQHPITLKEIPFTTVALRGVEVGYLDVTVTPVLDDVGTILGAIISFTDTTRYKQLQDEIQEANRELETAYEELQSSNEELETTNEELQSTIEELETTNEELQSTNEELETMNEELQSTNEELQAINDEFRLRSIDLNTLNAYLSSIMSSVKVGVVVLDDEFIVHLWNKKAEDLWGLRSGEAIGRHFLNLDIGLPVEKLTMPIRSVMSGDVGMVDSTFDASNRTGKPIQCRVTICPMTSSENNEQGVVLLMEQI